MKKQVFGRKFKRDKNQRKALFNGLISAMILNGSIKTTEEKAKSIRADVEKMVTKAKKNGLAKDLLSKVLKQNEVDKLINEIAPRFKNREGGYTRMIRLGRRFNDNASMVIMQWVEGEDVVVVKEPKEKAPKKETKPAKKVEIKEAKKSARKPVKPAVAKAKTGKK